MGTVCADTMTLRPRSWQNRHDADSARRPPSQRVDGAHQALLRDAVFDLSGNGVADKSKVARLVRAAAPVVGDRQSAICRGRATQLSVITPLPGVAEGALGTSGKVWAFTGAASEPAGQHR